MNFKKLLIQKYKNNEEISKSFLWRLLQVLSKQGTSALMFFIATFFLTKEDMGIYNYITAALLLLIIFSDFGISTSTSRYTAIYNTINKEKVKRIFFNTFLIIFLATILVTGVVLIFRGELLAEYSYYILYALPMILLSPLSSLLDGIYRGLKKFKTLAIVSLCNSVIGISVSFIFVPSYGIIGAIFAQTVYFSTYSFVLFVLYRGYEFKIEKKIIQDVAKYAFYFGIATLGFYFFSKINILILGKYNLFEEIAVYELLNKIFTVFLIPFSVFGQVLAPNIVEVFSLKKYKNVLNIFKTLLRYLLQLNAIFIPVSIILAYVIINFFFPLYSNGVLSTLILPISLTYAIAIPVTVINAGMLVSTGHAKLMAIQNVISGIVNVILNIIVIQKYGYVGVIWVTFAIQFISTGILYIVYRGLLLKLKK